MICPHPAVLNSAALFALTPQPHHKSNPAQRVRASTQKRPSPKYLSYSSPLVPRRCRLILLTGPASIRPIARAVGIARTV